MPLFFRKRILNHLHHRQPRSREKIGDCGKYYSGYYTSAKR
jgi:hypothetical protein